MDRRSFMSLGIVAGAAGMVLPGMVKAAASESPLASKMAGGVYYTKDAPGRWAKKAAGHVPTIEKKAAGDKIEIHVITPHGMKGWEHYIVKHMLLDKDFKFIAEKMFDPTKDKKPESTFTLDSYSGPLYAVSMCNVHDVWVGMITI